MHTCAYHATRSFERDAKKAAPNLRKNGIDFTDATLVFHDDPALTIADPHAEERRFVVRGRDLPDRVLVVVYAWPGNRIRMISAGRETRRERRQHEERR
jgi:uncharacterized DUF497 family protein